MSLALPYWRLAGLYFWYFAFVGAFSPFFALYLQALGRSAWEIGALLGAMQLVRIGAANFWAWRADRDGRRERVLVHSLVLGTLAWAAVFPAQGFLALAATLSLFAFLTGGVVPLAEAVTLAHLGAAAERYGRIRLWGSVGFIVAVTAVGLALDRLPVASLLWIVLATLAGTLGHAWALPPTAHPRAARGDSVLPLLAKPEIALFLAACFLMSVGHGALYAFYSIYLAGHGYSKGVIGAMWTIGVVAEIVAFLAMPRLTRRFGAGPILAVSFATAVVRFLAIGWLVGSPAALVFAQLLHGTTFGTYHAAALAVVGHWFRGASATRGQGLYLSISFGAGGMAGGLASGALWKTAGPGWTFTVSAAAAALALLAFAGQAKLYGARAGST